MQQHGVPRTELFSQNEIADALHTETNLPVIRNRCLMTGSAPNGDPLCIDRSDGTVLYVFHEVLWEEPDAVFPDMTAKTSLHPDEFPDAVFAGRDYPCDGSEAEEDPDIHKI